MNTGNERSDYFKSRAYAGMVGNRLRQARHWTGLQPVDVAERLGLTREQIRKIEKGRWLPPVYELVIMSEMLGCSADWVLGLSDDPKTREERIADARGSGSSPVENLDAIALDRCEGERAEDRYDPPTTQRERKRMCLSKRRYRSESSALRAAINSSKSFGQMMRTYRCPVCGGWHLTSQEQPDFDPMGLNG